MAGWLQVVIGVAAALTATVTIWRTLIKPMAELIVLQQRALPMLRDLTQVFATVPKPFDVLAEIVAEFRTDSGSSLRDVVNRLDAAASANAAAAEILKVQVEAARQLAVQDREQTTRLIVLIDRVTTKVDAGNASGVRMEAGAAVVAQDLADRHTRADAVGEGHPGEAADAAVRSDPDVHN